ncbi:MAG: ribonuclease III domain-containing protein [Eubacteriales bacterium]|nr:ribonuclease III domain-containing protein [Eubacteriales bacterium]
MRAEEYSISSLAWLGDALYELAIRKRLLESSLAASGTLHKKAIDFVAARAQALALNSLLPDLNPEEQTVVRRARNFHTPSLPKHQKPEDYRLATALEALLGWHDLRGENERNEELIEHCFSYLLDYYQVESGLSG